MEKTNIRRLLGVMTPFMIMVIVRRLSYLLLGETAMPEVLADTAAFVISSVVGIIFFRMSCGKNALHPSDDIAPTSEYSDYGEYNGDDTAQSVPPFPKRDTPVGRILYTRLAVAGMVIAMYVVTMTTDVPYDNTPSADFLVAEFVSTILIHPIVEEYLFRYLYYRELRPMQPIFAGLAQAIMFAIVHNSVGGMVYALFAGVILAFVAENSGSLSVAIISHMLVNLRSFLYLTCLSDTGAVASLADPARVRTIIDFVIVSVGFAALLLLLVRRGMRDMQIMTANATDNDTDTDNDTEDTPNNDEESTAV